MNALYELKEKLQRELDEIAQKQEMSAGDLEAVHKLTDTIKNIDKICMLEDEEGGYSRDGDWEAQMRGNYSRGGSYGNRGKHYVRGHYSRDGYSRDNYSGNSYSRDGNMGRGGYSRENGHIKEELRRLMEETDDENMRNELRMCMNKIESR